MTYRQSRYDPLAHEIPGRPLRPFNKVQWLGVVMEVLGGGMLLLWLGGRLGWLAAPDNSAFAAIVLLGMGSLLIGSRREPGRPVSEAELRRNRLWLAGSLALALLVIAVLFLWSGGRP